MIDNIRPSGESIPQHGPCRSLMANGVWLEKPADAERYERPRDIVVEKPHCVVTRSLYSQPPSHRTPPRNSFAPGHPKYGGRKVGTVQHSITGAQIVARLEAGETLNAIALAERCSAESLYLRIKRAGLKSPEKMCRKCGKPTLKKPQAKFCGECAVDVKYSRQVTSTKKWRRSVTALCAVEGCKQRGAYGRGMCSKHYQQVRKLEIAAERGAA